MTSTDRDTLVARVYENLADLLPAHDVLTLLTAACEDELLSTGTCGDVVHVQGRGDRLHGVLCVTADTADEAKEASANSDMNWRWWAFGSRAEANAAQADAESAGVGVIVAPADGALEKLREAPPNPGIFIKSFPKLRKEWRTIASW